MLSLILKAIPNGVKLVFAFATGAALMYYPAKWVGAASSVREAQIATLEKSVETLRERAIIDATVSDAGATDMCRFMGLSEQDYLECVRRVGATDTLAGNVDNDHPTGSPVCEPGCCAQRAGGQAGLLEIGRKAP